MIASVLGRRVRGFRVVNVAALAIAMVMAMGVYWAKTSAAREAAAIADVQRQITLEQRRTRLLQAEIAYLERPDRLTELAAARRLAPVPADREASTDALSQIAQLGQLAEQAQRRTQAVAAAGGPAAPTPTTAATPAPAAPAPVEGAR